MTVHLGSSRRGSELKESKVTFFSFRTGSSDAAAAKGFFRYKVRADLGVKAAWIDERRRQGR